LLCIQVVLQEAALHSVLSHRNILTIYSWETKQLGSCVSQVRTHARAVSGHSADWWLDNLHTAMAICHSPATHPCRWRRGLVLVQSFRVTTYWRVWELCPPHHPHPSTVFSAAWLHCVRRGLDQWYIPAHHAGWRGKRALPPPRPTHPPLPTLTHPLLPCLCSSLELRAWWTGTCTSFRSMQTGAACSKPSTPTGTGCVRVAYLQLNCLIAT
jgi:hypothetical protein